MRTRTRLALAAVAAGAVMLNTACADEVTPDAAAEQTEQTTTTEKQTTTTESRETPSAESVLDDTDADMLAWTEVSLPYSQQFMDLLDEMGVAAGAGDSYSMESLCNDLTDLAQDAERDTLPAPLPDLDSAWGGALDSFEDAGIACSVGASSMDVGMIDQATSLISEATEYLAEATSQLEDYTASI